MMSVNIQKLRLDLVILDDHEMFADALQSRLKKYPFLNVRGSFTKFEQLKTYLKNNHVDVLILDLKMPDKDGFEISRYVSEIYKNTVITILTMENDEYTRRKSILSGATHFVTKGEKIKKLVETIVSGRLGEKLIKLNPEDGLPVSRNEFLLGPGNLSKREFEICQLAVAGKSNEEIGEQLFISPLTAKTHRVNSIRKLKLKNTAQLIDYWYSFED